MKHHIGLFLSGFLVLGHVHADPWTFDKPIDITKTKGTGIFHHLESSGRRNIAVSTNTIAVTWEDNRDKTSRIYLSRKNLEANSFSSEVIISGNQEAFEPSIVALPGNRFVIAWEEDEHVKLRMLGQNRLGPIIQAGRFRSMQASLSTRGEEVLLVLSDQSGKYGKIMLYTFLANQDLRLSPQASCTVDPEPPRDQQTYPAVVTLPASVIIGWEDRRPGHTIIMAGESKPGTNCSFKSPVRISENWRSNQSATYGKGTGASRVAMASYGASGVLAVWADKRNFREGYDIFSADRLKQGGFDHNVRVQDSFGSVARQRHPTVTGDQNGRLVAAWDDDRDGTIDIVLSWREKNDWSDDLVLPGASGPGIQNHPTITLDQQGNLHIAWVERATIDGPTQLKYMFGKATHTNK